MLAARENFFRDQISFTVLGFQFCAQATAQLFEILGGIVEAVGMVYAKSIKFSLGDKVQDELVGLVKDVFVLGTESGEIVDIEEAAVVDVIRGRAPLGEAVGLGLDQFMQRVEAAGIVGCSVNGFDARNNELPGLRRTSAKSRQPAL